MKTALIVLSAMLLVDRPSAEDVAKAVAESREKYATEYPVLSREEYVEAIKSRVVDLKYQRSHVQKAWTGQKRAVAIAVLGRQISEAEKLLAKASKPEFVVPDPGKRLYDLKINFTGQPIGIGRVGRLATGEQSNGWMLTAHCVRVMSDKSVEIRLRWTPPFSVDERVSFRPHGFVIVLHGLPADGLKPDQQIFIEPVDVICAKMTPGRVHMEVFDPDKPFQ